MSWLSVWPRKDVFVTAFLFYFVLSNLFHVVADYYFPKVGIPVGATGALPRSPNPFVRLQRWALTGVVHAFYQWTAPLLLFFARRYDHEDGARWSRAKLQSKIHEVVRSWVMSYIHALFTTLIATWVWCIPPLPPTNSKFHVLLMHTCGYFLADGIVNPHIMYLIHHFTPFPFLHILFCLEASLANVSIALAFAEMGNTLAHAATIFSCKSGTAFLTIRRLAFWVSRPPAIYFGYRAYRDDLPVAIREHWLGTLCYTMFFLLSLVNGVWMVGMLVPASWRKRILAPVCTLKDKPPHPVPLLPSSTSASSALSSSPSAARVVVTTTTAWIKEL